METWSRGSETVGYSSGDKFLPTSTSNKLEILEIHLFPDFHHVDSNLTFFSLPFLEVFSLGHLEFFVSQK